MDLESLIDVVPQEADVWVREYLSDSDEKRLLARARKDNRGYDFEEAYLFALGQYVIEQQGIPTRSTLSPNVCKGIYGLFQNTTVCPSMDWISKQMSRVTHLRSKVYEEEG